MKIKLKKICAHFLQWYEANGEKKSSSLDEENEPQRRTEKKEIVREKSRCDGVKRRTDSHSRSHTFDIY